LLTLSANERALGCGFETEPLEGDVSDLLFSYFRVA
jgi:hypothetical protein